MEKRFLFGRAAVDLVGDRHIVESVSDGWQRFEKAGSFCCPEADPPEEDFSSCPSCRLRLEPGYLPSLPSPEIGWTSFRDGGTEYAVFRLDGASVFALTPESAPGEIIIRAEGQNDVCGKGSPFPGESAVQGERDALPGPVLSARAVQAWRLGCLYGMLTALRRDCVGVHAVTALCGGEISLLAAPGGTGKTTLGELLEEYADGVVINGDFAMLSLSGNGVWFEPTPFCGSSGRALNQRVRVDRIVFLEQGKTSLWKELTGREALISLVRNTFVPPWDSELAQPVMEQLPEILNRVRAGVFPFVPTQEAARVFLEGMDRREPDDGGRLRDALMRQIPKKRRNSFSSVPNPEGLPWVCPFCGARIILRDARDGPAHMVRECTKNPFR